VELLLHEEARRGEHADAAVRELGLAPGANLLEGLASDEARLCITLYPEANRLTNFMRVTNLEQNDLVNDLVLVAIVLVIWG